MKKNPDRRDGKHSINNSSGKPNMTTDTGSDSNEYDYTEDEWIWGEDRQSDDDTNKEEDTE